MAKEFSGDISKIADGQHLIDVHGGVIVTLETTYAKKGEPTRAKFEQTDKSKSFVPWGADNLFPVTIRDIIRKSPILSARLEARVNMLYSGGIVWGTLEHDEKGNEIFNPKMNDAQSNEIRSFLRRSNFEHWALITLQNEVRMQNGWCEFVFNLGQTEITRIKAHPAKDCRMGWQNKQGIVDKTFIYGDWERDPSGKGAIWQPTIDPSFDQVGQIQNINSTNIIMPVGTPDTFANYYALAPWDSARMSGWLDLSFEIPKYKKAIMKNEISPKYIIRASESYWKERYPNWGQLKSPERKKIFDAFTKEIKDKLASPDNAGKFLFGIDKYDPASGKEVRGLTIEEIGSKIKDGQYLDDINESSSQILTGLGEDPAISGGGPGKNYGSSGSGSDKKVAWDIFYALARPKQDMAVAPLGVVRDVNGWDEDLVFRWRYALQNSNLYSSQGLPANQNQIS